MKHLYEVFHGFDYEQPEEKSAWLQHKLETLEDEGWEIFSVTIHKTRNPQPNYLSKTWEIVARKPR